MSLAPGLLRASLIAAVALPLSAATGLDGTAWAILIGLAIGQWQPPTQSELPGLRFGAGPVLLVAIALLGARIRVSDIEQGGVSIIALALLAIAAALGSAWLLGRWFKLPRALAMCLGIGTGICGASAIAATRRAIDADDDQVALSVASITLLGTLGMFMLPTVQVLGWFSSLEFGQWAGASLHAVPQALAAGFAGGGNEGGRQAGLVKMARVAMLPIAAILLARLAGKRGRASIPKEVVWFSFMFLLSLSLSNAARNVVVEIDRLLFMFAFAAITSMVQWRSLLAAPRALATAVGVWVAVLVTTATWILL